jgi:methyl-accepting chemotaxis protein
MFRNLKTITKIISIIIVMAICMGLIGFVGYYFNQRASQEMTDIYADKLLPANWINTIRVNNRAVEVITLQLILANNDKVKEKELEQQLVKLKDDNEKLITNYEMANLDGFQKQDIAKFKEVRKIYVAEQQKVLELALAGQKQEAYKYYEEYAIPQVNMINQICTELAEYNAKTSDEINSQHNLEVHFANQMLISIPILAIILALILGLWVARMITKPLNLVVTNVQEIATGNLTVRTIENYAGDEVGQLIKAMNIMIENYRFLIRNVAQAAGQLASSSEELAASAEQSTQAATQVAGAITEVADGAEQQLTSINNVTASVEQGAARIQQIVTNSAIVGETTAKTAGAAKEGLKAVESAMNQMESIERTVNNSAAVVARLGARSKEIGLIVDAISGIAGQTNLLALNAAIEAARAGEQGRGFAVVAEEVRKLAEQSQESASQIANLISEIQNETDTAVLAMNEGTKEVKIGTEVVNHAGQSFKEIASLIEGLSTQGYEIGTSIQQMGAESQQMVLIINQIDRISKKTAGETQTVSAATEEQYASMQEIANSSQGLSKMAEELQHSISKFRI